MSQIIQQEQTILQQLQTLSPVQQQTVKEFIEFLSTKNINNQSLEEDDNGISFVEDAQEFIGCVNGGPGDLATNKQYLEGFGIE